ncbi:MAG: ATP-binding protein [Planctomycetes bacterium]|nr:ATP-binding protein [Planctomycetota bacterium]
MFNVENFLQQNPWRDDASKLMSWTFDRSLLPQLQEALKGNTPILLSGPRGAGKTTLLQLAIRHLIKDKGVSPSAIFYFNLDDVLTRECFTGADDVARFINGFSPDKKTRLLILLDEAQNIDFDMIQELEKVLDNTKLIMTSSARAYHYDSAVNLELGLASYTEYMNRMLNPNNIYLPDGKDRRPKLKLPDKIKDLTSVSYLKPFSPVLDGYLRYGGYAEAVKEYTISKRPAILRKIYQTQFDHQPKSKQERLQQTQQRKILDELARTHGTVLNVTKLSQETKANWKTVSAFVDTLESNYYINKVYPYPEKTNIAKDAPILYFNDNGLRNMLIDSFQPVDTRPDRKALIDNLVYNELRFIPWIKEIKYWMGETSDVTGYCLKRGLVRHLVGARYDFPLEKSGRWALVNFGRRIKAKKIIVLTRDYAGWEEIAPTQIVYLPLVHAWLLPQVLGE